MHPAPAVAFQAGDDGAWRLVATAGTAFVTMVMAIWLLGWVETLCVDAGQAPWPGSLLAVPVVMAGALAALLAWRRLSVPAPRLAWDGRGWQLQLSGEVTGRAIPGRVAIRIDLGGWMLLRFEPEGRGRAHWLAVGARAVGPARAALVDSGRRRTEPGEEAA